MCVYVIMILFLSRCYGLFLLLDTFKIKTIFWKQSIKTSTFNVFHIALLSFDVQIIQVIWLLKSNRNTQK